MLINDARVADDVGWRVGRVAAAVRRRPGSKRGERLDRPPRVRLACSRRRHPVCSFAAGVSPGVGADVCFSRGLSGVWTGKAQISSNVSAWNRSSLLWIQGTLRNVLASYEQLWIFLMKDWDVSFKSIAHSHEVNTVVQFFQCWKLFLQIVASCYLVVSS